MSTAIFDNVLCCDCLVNVLQSAGVSMILCCVLAILAVVGNVSINSVSLSTLERCSGVDWFF